MSGLVFQLRDSLKRAVALIRSGLTSPWFTQGRLANVLREGAQGRKGRAQVAVTAKRVESYDPDFHLINFSVSARSASKTRGGHGA